jgi:hypothetical protein
MPKRRKVEARISTHLRGKRGGHHRLANMYLDCAMHAYENSAPLPGHHDFVAFPVYHWWRQQQNLGGAAGMDQSAP